jgi:multidrug transporter EmrE-like cation transporter
MVLSFGFYAAAEFLSKRWSVAPTWELTGIITLFYALCGAFWLPLVFRKHSLSVAGGVWSVMATVITILLGVILFKEKLSGTQSIGLVAAIVALVLLEIG